MSFVSVLKEGDDFYDRLLDFITKKFRKWSIHPYIDDLDHPHLQKDTIEGVYEFRNKQLFANVCTVPLECIYIASPIIQRSVRIEKDPFRIILFNVGCNGFLIRHEIDCGEEVIDINGMLSSSFTKKDFREISIAKLAEIFQFY